jgi:hypothetical protein
VSQDEHRGLLPGQVDFDLPQAQSPYGTNGRHPLNGRRPRTPAGEPRDTVDVWDRRVAGGLAFLRRRLAGAYEVDDFGFDQDLTDSIFYPLRPAGRQPLRHAGPGRDDAVRGVA